jgi:hypothetical protein
MANIRLSEKHGVNPALSLCFFCNQEKNELVLLGRLPDDAEAPRKAVFNTEPCDECKGYMGMGIICISVDPVKSPDHKNPWRTGGWVVLRDEALLRFGLEQEMLDDILRKRVCFLEDEVWDKLGLPRVEREKKEEHNEDDSPV